MSNPDIKQAELPFQFPSVMEKVRTYGYNHLMQEEQVTLTFELVGYDGPNPGFKTVKELFDAQEQKLKKHFSKTQIIRLKTIRELSAQYLKEEIMKSKTILSNPQSVVDFLKLKIGSEAKEHMLCIFLDAKNQLIDCKIMSSGTVDQVVLYPREIIKEALDCNATGIIMAHNHPSGETDPSGCDIRLTENMKNAADALGIKLLDHMVVGDKNYFSFLEEGLLEGRAEFGNKTRKITEKELLRDPTVTCHPKEEPVKDVSKAFIEAIGKLKDDEKHILNNRLKKIMGCENLKVENLPNTMYVLDKTFNSYLAEYKDTGYVDFEKIEENLGFHGSKLYRIFDKEVYSFFERNYLEESELERFKSLVPDAKTRQNLFADYIRQKPIDLTDYTLTERSFIKKLFKKIVRKFFKLLGKKHELEVLFEDFKQGRYKNPKDLNDDKTIINASELGRYESLDGIDMIIGNVDFGKTDFKDTGDVTLVTGTAKFTDSEITSLGKIREVGELDLRASLIKDSGELKTVRNNVYSNSRIRVFDWKDVDIGKDLFSAKGNMTDKYKLLKNFSERKTPEKQAEKSRDRGIEMER